MGKSSVLCLLSVAVVMFGSTATASALEGGGKMPSEAPLISAGAHYTASLGNRRDQANYVNGNYSNYQVAIWQLGPVSTHDKLVVNWHALPFAHRTGFPVRMLLVENVDDYSWGTAFGQSESSYSLSGSGTSRTEITLQNSSSTDYLEFYSEANQTESEDFETYPYDFSVEAPRHFLALSLTPVSTVPANGVIEGTVLNAVGQPPPDGLIFGLTATWGKSGTASYTASTVGGHLAFQLALPESAVGQRASIGVGRGADASFQEVAARTSTKVLAPIVPPAPPPTACETAKSKLHVLGRQLHRLQSHVRRAGRRASRSLRHRAHQAGKKFGKAKRHAHAVC